jgi:hypothetical protein
MLGSKPAQGFAGDEEERRDHDGRADAPAHGLHGCAQSSDILLNGCDIAPEAGLHAGNFCPKARAHVIHGLTQSRESGVHLAAQLANVPLRFIEAGVNRPGLSGDCFV